MKSQFTDSTESCSRSRHRQDVLSPGRRRATQDNSLRKNPLVCERSSTLQMYKYEQSNRRRRWLMGGRGATVVTDVMNMLENRRRLSSVEASDSVTLVASLCLWLQSLSLLLAWKMFWKIFVDFSFSTVMMENSEQTEFWGTLQF